MAATKEKTPNYTPEMVEQMAALYQEHGNDGMQMIADTLGKSVRSVRSKLVREGIYIAPEKGAASPKKDGPTKKEMLIELEALVPFPVDGLMGATKEAIGLLIEAFTPEPQEE
jgi:hypothetical protein